MKVLFWYAFVTTVILPSVFGFSASNLSSQRAGHERPPAKPNFHRVLQEVGKTVLRPGGSEGTNILHGWADLKPSDTALELSSGLGTGGMALARRYGCRVILTDKDEARLRLIDANLANGNSPNKDIPSQLATRKLDMLKIEEEFSNSEHFDAVVVEASLSHMPDKVKKTIMQSLQPHTEMVLLHEICLDDDCLREEANMIRQNVGSALGIGFHPMPLRNWIDMLETSGYKVTREVHGPMKLLNPKNLLQDEGPVGLAQIAWNLATKPELRERVLSTKKVIDSHSEHLGYVLLKGVKK